MTPYKIVAYDIGCASIYPRAGGDRVGWVLQNYSGYWEAFVTRGVPLGQRKYRADAAALVWMSR